MLHASHVLLLALSLALLVQGSTRTVQQVISARGCNTAAVAGLADQLVVVAENSQPGLWANLAQAPYNECVTLSESAGAVPYIQKPAADSLCKMSRARGRKISINSGLRTLPQQLCLFKWQGSCGITVAAAPGGSNHNGGAAVDINDSASWRSTFLANGWTWQGSGDPVHYNWVAARDVRSSSVLAFQRLWNLNNPNSRIAENGVYGSSVESALLRSPADGFPNAPGRAAVAAPPVAAPPAPVQQQQQQQQQQPANTRPLPRGPACSFQGKAGVCIDRRSCNGTPHSGLCRGRSSIQCCIPNDEPAPVPVAPAAPVVPAEPVAPAAPVAPAPPTLQVDPAALADPAPAAPVSRAMNFAPAPRSANFDPAPAAPAADPAPAAPAADPAPAAPAADPAPAVPAADPAPVAPVEPQQQQQQQQQQPPRLEVDPGVFAPATEAARPAPPAAAAEEDGASASEIEYWSKVVRGVTRSAKPFIVDGLSKFMPRMVREFQLNTPLRVAHFLAQCAHESASFTVTTEFASGAAYEGRRDLGNTQRGDGVRFKGRGLIQLTGRSNYARYGSKLGVDFISNPPLAAQFPWAALTAGLYWQDRNINALADRDDVVGVTRKVNGGTNGLSDRRNMLANAKRALAQAGPIPGAGSRASERDASVQTGGGGPVVSDWVYGVITGVLGTVVALIVIVLIVRFIKKRKDMQEEMYTPLLPDGNVEGSSGRIPKLTPGTTRRNTGATPRSSSPRRE